MVEDLNFTHFLVTLIWISHKRICGRAGLSAVPAVFLVTLEKTVIDIVPCNIIWGHHKSN